jgi:hypothetical protein
MSEIKHSPGPWFYSGKHDECEVRYVGLCEGERHTDNIATLYHAEGSEQEANAHLIAAAPEMLEALMALNDLRGAWSPPDDVIKAAWAKARAAIAKATGAA